MFRTLSSFSTLLRPLFLSSPAATVGRVPAPAASLDLQDEKREERARPRIAGYFLFLAQLGLLLATVRTFRVEEAPFFWLCSLVFGGFAIHYWLPFRYKEPFWISLSLAGAFVLLDPVAAAALIGAGLVLFAMLRAPIGVRWSLSLVAGTFLALMLLRTTNLLPVPRQFWMVFGALFMFRLIIYLYDLSHAAGVPTLREFLAYFYLLPNYYFLLFPVIDFRTMRRSYYEKDIHETAQQGISWMVRGTVHLLLYRTIYLGDGRAVDNITSFSSLLGSMVLTYLLYLRVSGQFHIIVGMLHLFGYHLPETNRRYLLASSLTDFWRRINIYWKDFMVKVVYFPVYFRLRRGGEVRAQVLATAVVFVVTWFLHGYQQFWLVGSFMFRWTDAAFWGLLGLLVIVNLLFEMKNRGAKAARVAQLSWLQRGMRVAGTFLLITVLWSLWNAASLHQWLDMLTWWKIGI